MNALPEWMQTVDALSVVLGALLLVPLLVWWWQQARRQADELAQAEALLQRQKQDLEHNEAELQRLRDEQGLLQQQQAQVQAREAELVQHRTRLEAQLETLRREQAECLQARAALEARFEAETRSGQEKLARLEQMREQMKQEFAELSRQLLERESRQFAQQSENRLQQLLQPVQQRLQEFQQQMQRSREQDMKDRAGLEQQIRMLVEANRRITDEAQALSRALTGQAKLRGNWGERQIEHALEMSGLEEGREFQREVTLKDERGRSWRPDVLVHLPEGRCLIVDAKLSLNHYIEYVNAEEEAARRQAMKAHVQALKMHVKSLADKRYDRLEGIRSLDFVLMFVPNESAFIEAINHEPALYDEAFRQRVVLVTTSTLLATLQTVANLWRYEKQQRNAQKMAEHAARLYDKFAGFVEDMEKLGQRLDQARASYDGAMNKLRDGRGNLMRQMDGFVQLGAQPRKRLNLDDTPEADAPAPEDGAPGHQ